MKNKIRHGVPELPAKMAPYLPIDDRGYPVPYFVARVNGKPDHRIVDPAKMADCVEFGRCWICGGKLGAYKTFVIGPMCAVNRVNSEPPAHLQCAQYAVTACPFMTRPHMVRRDAGLPDDVQGAAGVPLERNPGVMCLWTTKKFQLFTATSGNSGVLFRLGDPETTEWWTQGRHATREEIEVSIQTGIPILEQYALEEGPGALKALELAKTRLATVLMQQFKD